MAATLNGGRAVRHNFERGPLKDYPRQDWQIFLGTGVGHWLQITVFILLLNVLSVEAAYTYFSLYF
jgi:hypothetical protein